MKILIYLGHPAHFYNYKNVIPRLKSDGHQVEILIKKKDVLQELLDNAGIPYHNILKEGRKDTKLGILWGTLKRAWRLNVFCSKFHLDILTGTSVENSWIGKLRHIPVININEDDADVVRNMPSSVIRGRRRYLPLLFVTMESGMKNPSSTTVTTSWPIFTPIILRRIVPSLKNTSRQTRPISSFDSPSSKLTTIRESRASTRKSLSISSIFLNRMGGFSFLPNGHWNRSLNLIASISSPSTCIM